VSIHTDNCPRIPVVGIGQQKEESYEQMLWRSSWTYRHVCLTDVFCIISAHKKMVQQKMRKMVLMWRNRSTSVAFERWVEHTDEHKRLRNLTVRIVARWQNKTVSTVFWAWAGTRINTQLHTLLSHTHARVYDIVVILDIWCVAEHWEDLKAREKSADQGSSRVRSLTYSMTFDPKKSESSMMSDVTRFETSLFADVSQALAETFKAADNKEAATQIRIKNTLQKNKCVEVEYRAAQACNGPSPQTLADEISRQVSR
jgi:hypothetical protein